MKKIILFIFFFVSILAVSGQETQLDLNFNDGQTAFTITAMPGTTQPYILTVTNGVLNIETHKIVNDWSFLGLWGKSLSLTALKTVQFSVKTDMEGVNFNVTMKSPALSGGAKVGIQVTQALTIGDGTFTHYFFEVSDLIDANPEFQPALIDEFQIEVSNGWTSTTDGVVELDYLKFGYAEPTATGGTSFVENFDAGLPAGVSSNSRHTVSATGGIMEVEVHKQDRWQVLDFNLGATYDFTSKPIVNIDVRSENPVVMQLFLVDENGNGFASEWIESQYTYYELVSGKNEFRQARVFPDTEFSTVSFDFSDANPAIVDLSTIIQFKLCINGTALTYDGKYWIEEIRAGDDATKSTYIGQVSDTYISSLGAKSQLLLVPEIMNATGLTLAGGGGLITNVVVDPITYIDRTENGRAVKYGYTKIHFDLIPDAIGFSLINLTATGSNGYEDYIEQFTLHVTKNSKPSINQPDDVVVKVGVENSIKLTGVSDGDPEIDQDLTLAISSDNLAVVDAPDIMYTQDFTSATVTFTALSAGTANTKVVIRDEGGAKDSIYFNIIAFDELNTPPTIAAIEDITVLNNSGENSIALSGISDGDGTSQNLTLTAVSSAPGIIPDPVITYTQGESTGNLVFTPVPGETGSCQITVTIADDGGNASNDGDKSTEIIFTINSLNAGVTGYQVDLTDPNVLAAFGAGGMFNLSVVQKDGQEAIKIDMTAKSTWDGIFLTIPELDLSENPLVSYEVYSEDITTYHWNYFYEVHGRDGGVNRNIENSNDHKFSAAAGVWTTIAFDYRGEGDMNNDVGTSIDASRIDALLINMHDNLQGWPFTEFTGTVYYRNLKFGDLADVADPVYSATIDDVPAKSVFEGTESVSFTLSGISDGKGGTAGITLSAASSDQNVAGNIVIGEVNSSGEASITIETGQAGSSTITLSVSAVGATDKSISFKVSVEEIVPLEFATVDVYTGEKNQTIRGFGTFQNEKRWSDLYATELGSSAVRIGLIGNQWEPVNDNDNSSELNMEGFNYNVFDWDYFTGLKERGVETFIITSWSPPAWMKRNLSLDHKGQAVVWENTDNILDPVYYDEFAEMWVGLIKAFKEQCDIDITGIGLQNEPFFNEPYPSAILGPDQFPELIEIVGNRLSDEGLDHVKFFMPEQVFGFFAYRPEDYHDALIANSVADSYTPYFAVHGYDQTGIDSDFPDYTRWRDLYDRITAGTNPKEMWMSETHIAYEGWTSALSLAGAIHGSLWAGNISLWTNWSFGDMQLTRNEPNSSFYVSENYFKYIRPGAVRIETEMDHPDLLATAFENTDGTFVMVLINKSNANIMTGIRGDIPDGYDIYRTSANENFVPVGTFELAEGVVILPASSVSTFVSNRVKLLTMNQPDNVVVDHTAGNTEVAITGISNGAGGVDNLTMEFTSSNAALFSDIHLSEIGGGGDATLSFTPIEGVTGFTKITLTLTDADENNYSVAFYITVVTSDQVDSRLADDLRIYPNPASEILYIELPGDNYTSLEVLDITGKIMFSESAASLSSSISTTDFPDGIYLLRISGKDGTLVKMFVVE